MSVWNDDLYCHWRRIEVNDPGVISLYFPEDDCCDMSGAIRFCKRIMPDVHTIYCWSGGVKDNAYFYRHGEWTCHRLNRVSQGNDPSSATGREQP